MGAIVHLNRGAPLPQPKSVPQVDWSNPLTQGLADIWIPSIAPHGLVTGVNSTNSMPGITRATSAGLGQNFTTGGRKYSTTLMNGTQAAYLVVAHRTNASANCSIVRKNATLTPMQEWDGQVRMGAWTDAFAIVNYGPVGNYANKVSTFAGAFGPREKFIFSNGGANIAIPLSANNLANVSTDPFIFGAADVGAEVASNWSILFIAIWAGSKIPTIAQLRQVEQNPYQLLRNRRLPVFARSEAAADTSLTGGAASVVSAFGNVASAVRMAGAAAASISTTGNLSTNVRMAGVAQATSISSAALTSSVRMIAAPIAQVTASGTLSTAVRMVGAAQAQVSATAGLATPGAGLSSAARAEATAAGTLGTAIRLTGVGAAWAIVQGGLGTSIPLAGTTSALAFAYGALTTKIVLGGGAAASATANGTLIFGKPSATLDISKIPASRIVVFEGSGSRVTPFEGSGSRVTRFQ